MRNYLYKVIDKIIIFPNEYYSTINEAYRKAEFNPRYKAIVFSWSDFAAGFDTASDNLNLGIHEFTHVLHYNSLKSDAASATIFTRWFTKINKEVNNPLNRNRLINSNYFRVHAYTNAFEFLAVIIEHFFESPEDFRQEFPELYSKVALMLNQKK
jgi:Mlc titration factor MtfA (ptsG expression regulator)